AGRGGPAGPGRPRRLLRAQDQDAARPALPGPASRRPLGQAREGPRAPAHDPLRPGAGVRVDALALVRASDRPGGRVSATPLLDALRPRAAWRWRTLLWVLAAWTLVGFFRGADRYFSDPFQRQRLEFGLWEALAQSLLASYIWAAMTPAVVVLAKHSLPSKTNWAAPLSRLFAVGLVL